MLSLRERVSQLETEVSSKSEEVASAIAAREEALASSSAELTKLKEEAVTKMWVFVYNFMLLNLKAGSNNFFE